MSDHDSSKQLKDLGQRLQKTVDERRGKASEAATEGAAAGLALRAVLELAVGIAVTMGLGWMADRYFGTAPWIMLALMPLGLAAGVMNVMRLGNSKRANEILDGPPGASPAPSVKDEDDD
jgi:ATP synthase protein I